MKKCQQCIQAIPSFHKVFGKANTIGVDEQARAELMSSEASSDGEADPTERDQMRVEQGAGRRALKRCKVVFRSEKVCVPIWKSGGVMRLTVLIVEPNLLCVGCLCEDS